jgi:hypothetical protein
VEPYVRKIAFHRKPAPTFRSFLGTYRRRIVMAASVIGIALVKGLMRKGS